MTTVTYFITGLRVTDPVTFTLTSATPPPNPMPDLKVRSKVGGDSSVAAVEKTWTVSLGAGDHILWIEGPDDDQWLGAALALTSVAELVVHDAAASPPALLGWGTSAVVIAAKDPWPPPSGPKSVGDSAWFLAQFASISVIAPKGL